ncbi:MAG: hypothetical protein MK098_07675 [Marinovum sp.]|nr:hypothetical protein [Marinovum sp.]
MQQENGPASTQQGQFVAVSFPRLGLGGGTRNIAWIVAILAAAEALVQALLERRSPFGV